jgi:hypothetical protein
MQWTKSAGLLANTDGFQVCGFIPTQDLLPRLVTTLTAKAKPFHSCLN